MGEQPDDEDKLLRSVAIQNARSILLARQRAEQELVAAKEALEVRTHELERANALIRTIAENATSSLLMLNDRGIVTYMNTAAIDETGYALEEMARAPFHDILHAPVDQGGHSAEECPIRNARDRGLPLRKHRDVFLRKNGSAFPVACSLSPLHQAGRPSGAVLEFRDITEELLAQRTLEEANRKKDQFLATLSHELRTPMTAILGWARMLKLGLSGQEAREAIDVIEKSAEIQSQLIDDVLDVSRTLAGKMTVVPVPVDLGPVLQAAMATVHPALAAKGIEILASVPPILPRVLGDQGRLQQVIWNLLSNAVKFTPRGGTIKVRLSVVGSILRLTVQDSGKGIDPAYLPHVFEPFSQEDASMTRAHEGIGLGLSIVRSLVELHGGRVRAASGGGGLGATFTVELPILETGEDYAAPTEPAPAPKTSATPVGDLPALPGVRVLVVDDQNFTRDLVEAIFRRVGSEVSVAKSVREGLERFHEVMPDVVICDLAMPEQDGFAFLEAVRALNTESRSTPIVALTAFGSTEDRDRALAAGFDAYLKKPAHPEDIVSCVVGLLNEPSRGE